MKLLLALLFFTALSLDSFAAGTIATKNYDISPVRGKRVRVTFTADSSDGSLPATEIGLGGLVVKVVTNPGTPAPTANYDIDCGDPSDSALDVFGGALLNRHTSNTEQVYPVISGATMPVMATTCTLHILNNSVNSAVGVIDFYILYP